MASVASQLIEEVTAHAQSDSFNYAERYTQMVLNFQINYVYPEKEYYFLYQAAVTFLAGFKFYAS